MIDEWTDWIAHDGRACPVKGMWVHVIFDEGTPLEKEGIALGSPVAWDWSIPRIAGYHWGKVIRYRIRKPRALLQLIEMVENLPAPAQPRVDA